VENQTTKPVSKRILCVEDDNDTCEIFQILFREYDLVFANNLEDAHPLINCQYFDLYVLDNWLPDGSGIDLCRTIRARHPGSPILFTSAVGMKKDLDEAAAAGANRYLLKPCEPDTLVKIVKELIGQN
jgi:Response regulator containing CheY-like receiver, AAA-type ATPase, and DNA-binding domains